MRKHSGLAAAALVCVLALVMFGVWKSQQKAPAEGRKTITVEVTHSDGSSREFTYETDKEYLGELLEEEGLISGTESAYGLFVDTVDGEKADYDAGGAWWRLTCEGNAAETGADAVALEDGKTYGWVYTTG